MIDKPRKWWLAGLLSTITIGLGHIYSGQLRKGIILYLIQGLIFALFFLFLVHYPNIFLIIATIILGFTYFISVIIDAIRSAKQNSGSYFLKKYNRWYVYLVIVLLANFLIQPYAETFIKENAVKAYKIASGAMSPTLLGGDRILINRHIYQTSEPQKGDIIVFSPPHEPSKDFVKRLVGTEGDVVEIKNKQLFINGITQIENYIINIDNRILSADINSRDNFGPVTVPDNHLFFLGDNRDNSYDSRFWGFVNRDKAKGKVIYLYWSWDGDKGKVRWNRIGKSIDQVTN